uniref:Uncharacterized protein n=1 Tax=Panthera leo TaxID=9689 RepID=A0A8C8XK62_PANLE
MDRAVAEFIKRTILKIPVTEMLTVLQQTTDFWKKKESLVQRLVMLCEEKQASVNDAALVDVIYTQFPQHQKIWDIFQMNKGPGEDIDLFYMEQFKRSVKKILRSFRDLCTDSSKADARLEPTNCEIMT